MEDTPAPDSPTDRSIEDMYPSLVPISLDTIMPNQNLKIPEENYQEVKTRKIALNYCPTPKDLKPSPVN